MMVEVTQADREATDAIYEICSDEGMFATSRVTAVVATHRIQSTASLQSELAAKDAEIERLRRIAVRLCDNVALQAKVLPTYADDPASVKIQATHFIDFVRDARQALGDSHV